MSIKEIRPDKEFLAKKRRIFGRAVRAALADHGEEFAGFSLVTWDNRGLSNSAYYADTGPVGESLVPVFSHDALNRHVAVVTAKSGASDRIDGDQ